MFCKYECDYGPKDHPWVNQEWLFGLFFHQELLCTTKCDGNWFLPLNSHSNQWRSYSRCMWTKVHIMDVSVCSTYMSQVERVYMDPIRVKVHHEINLWQTQGNLVGKIASEWMTWDDFNDSKISPTWIVSIKGVFEAYIKTQHFPFSHGFVFILMMYFISNLHVK
jgi:hypothetical protein